MQITTEGTGSNVVARPGERINDCNPEEVRAELRSHGWVYFSGFSPTLDEFESFARRFGKCATPRIIHYPPGGVALGFHAEDSYNPWRPDALWFLCVSSGSAGGAPTGVVDGVALLQTLDAEWRNFSRENGLRFERKWSNQHWRQLAAGQDASSVSAYLNTLPGLSHEFEPDGTLRTLFDAPLVVLTQSGKESFSNTMLHAIKDPEYYGTRLQTDEPIPKNFVEHVERIALESEIHVGWETGDVALIDNTHMMHRRGEYSGIDRDLRVIHGEELFGTAMPPAVAKLEKAFKEALQGEELLRD